MVGTTSSLPPFRKCSVMPDAVKADFRLDAGVGRAAADHAVHVGVDPEKQVFLNVDLNYKKTEAYY